MINRLISDIVSFFLPAFIRGFKQGLSGQAPEQPEEKMRLEASPEDLEQAIIMVRDPSRVIRPFAYYMAQHFDRDDFTRAEIVENMTLSLENLGEEIMMHVPDSTITTKVERAEDKAGVLLHGHLDWKVDVPTPKVYAINMDLLKDGFVYRTDSNTFVITGRVPE